MYYLIGKDSTVLTKEIAEIFEYVGQVQSRTVASFALRGVT